MSPAKTSGIRLIVIGCSAGGIDALKNILPSLPAGFQPSVVVVQHIGPQVQSTLSEFFNSLCVLPVKEAEDKEPLSSGVIYFAPSGYHLLLEKDFSFALNIDPPVNYVRPAIDVFMESAAPICKDKAIGIVLTGANNDGAEGLKILQAHGARGLVQDPKTADFPAMPKAALEVSVTLEVMSLSDIAKTLAALK